MRHHGRRILIAIGIFLLTLLVLSTAVAWYLNTVWLPSRGKTQIEATLAKATGKQIQIDALRYVPLRGFVARSLTIANSPEPLVTASEVELRLALGPLLLSRTAAFKTSALLDLGQPVHVRADGAYHLDRHTLSLQVELDRVPMTVLAQLVTLPADLTIEAGVASVTADLASDADKHLKATGRLVVTAGRLVWRGIGITLDGTAAPTVTYQPADAARVAALSYTVDVALTRAEAGGVPTVGRLTDVTGSFTVTPETVTIRQLAGRANQLPWKATGTVALQPEPAADLTVEADLDLARDVALVPPPHQARIAPCRPTGRGHLAATLRGPLAQPARLIQQASLTLQEASADLSSPARGTTATLAGVNGRVEYTYADRRLTIPTLSGRLGAAPFTANGAVTLSPSVALSVHLTSDLDLARDVVLLPETYRSRVIPWQLAGRMHLAATLDGLLTSPLRLVQAADLTLEQGAARVPSAGGASIAFSRLNGTLHYADDRLTLRATGAADEQPLTLTASAEGSTTPHVTLLLESGPLTINADVLADHSRQHLQITALRGVWGRSRFALQGELSDWRRPQINLYDSEVELDWDDLSQRLPALQQATAAWPISGVTRHIVHLQGPAQDWTRWEAIVKSHSQRLTVSRLALEALFADARLQSGLLQLPMFRGAIAGGTAEGALQLNLREATRPFRLDLRLSAVDLATLRRHLGARQEKSDLSGQLAGRLELVGDLMRQETYRGGGDLAITGGKLFEKSLLGPIADLLQQPVLSRIAFHEAAGTFTVAQRRIATQDLRLISLDDDTGAPQAQIQVGGSVGFDQTLDLDATMALSERLTHADSTIGKIAGLITGTPLLNRVHIGGTLAKPKVSLLGGLPTDQIQELLRGIFGGD